MYCEKCAVLTLVELCTVNGVVGVDVHEEGARLSVGGNETSARA